MTSPYIESLLDDVAVRAMEGFSNDPATPNDEVAPNPPEDTGATVEEDIAALQRALYGADYPHVVVELPVVSSDWSSACC